MCANNKRRTSMEEVLKYNENEIYRMTDLDAADIVNDKNLKQHEEAGYRLLDPKNDFVFKAIFGNEDSPWSRPLMIRLLNIVLERDEDPIVDIEYKNPFSIGQDYSDKNIVMDIKLVTDRGERIDVEMQMIAYRSYPAGYRHAGI